MTRSLKSMGMAAFTAASATIGAPMTLHFEGMKLEPYYDSVGKLTWCGGETQIGYKENFTFAECSALFKMRYGWYSMRTANLYNDLGAQYVTLRCMRPSPIWPITLVLVRRRRSLLGSMPVIRAEHAMPSCSINMLVNMTVPSPETRYAPACGRAV